MKLEILKIQIISKKINYSKNILQIFSSLMINFIFFAALKSFEIKNNIVSDDNQKTNDNLNLLADISGSFGQNMNYNIQNETLTISGQNAIGPCNDLESCPYKQYNESVESIVIQEGISILSSYAFSGFENLKSISFPESVIYIGDYSFCNCQNLESISIPSNTFYIGTSSFMNCSNLQTITIPEKVNTLYADLFSGCNNIQSINILGNLTAIEVSVFKDCFQLKTIDIPTNSADITISNSTFENCINLVSVSIRGNILSIGSYAFKNCSSLKTLYFFKYCCKWSKIIKFYIKLRYKQANKS